MLGESDDPRSDGLDDFHGTAVAGYGGLSWRRRDGRCRLRGLVGMFRMGLDLKRAQPDRGSATQMQNVDVVNNNWTYGEAFTDNKNELKSAEFFEALTSAVDVGRRTRTVVVFAAGNYGEMEIAATITVFRNT